MRSPLAYPLNRSADMDAGGAADLQTDIMRFMAILSLCLVAIFALVQSIPLRPTEPVQSTEAVQSAEQTQVTATAEKEQKLDRNESPQPSPEIPPAKPADKAVALTRPKWIPRFTPETKSQASAQPEANIQRATSAAIPTAPIEEAPAPVESEPAGFTLTFESNAALTRLVASNRIGVYAIGNGRAQRMTVSESRISFWDASTPNLYHEMEVATVPAPVIDALTRSGTSDSDVSWGVTLPGQLKTQLEELMLEHRGGVLIIVSSGDIRWEAP